MDEQKKITKKGGTMRLGAWDCVLKSGTKAAKAYGATKISERHRHRYEFNNDYRDEIEKNGLQIVGTSPDGNLVEMVELTGHKWFVAGQFHPEFKSRPFMPHPLFQTFISASIKHGGDNAKN